MNTLRMLAYGWFCVGCVPCVSVSECVKCERFHCIERVVECSTVFWSGRSGQDCSLQSASWQV